MRFYEYRCPEHGLFDSRVLFDTQPCPDCHWPSRRAYGSVTFGTVLHEHYNPAFGTTVRSHAHARELAKHASAEQSERLGMDVSYELTGLADPDVHGIDKAEAEHYAAQTREANA